MHRLALTSGFVLVTGLTRPLALTSAGDDRAFIVTQRDLIWQPIGARTTGKIDIHDRVNGRTNDQGLLELAFHPAFSEYGRFLVT